MSIQEWHRACAERDRLEAENVRMREALNKIRQAEVDAAQSGEPHSGWTIEVVDRALAADASNGEGL